MQKSIWKIGGVVVLAAGHAFGHGDSGNILVGSEGGRVTVGRVSEDGSIVEPGERYFFTELGLDVPNEIDEVGFEADASLGVGTLFTFSFTRALRVWNGADFFSPASLTMGAFFGPQDATTPTTDIVWPGLTFAANPGDHDHPTWVLNAPATDGVYLMSLKVSAFGLQDSDEVWIVFGQNADEAMFDEAVEWAEANVPTPASALLLGGGVMMFGRRRR